MPDALPEAEPRREADSYEHEGENQAEAPTGRARRGRDGSVRVTGDLGRVSERFLERGEPGFDICRATLGILGLTAGERATKCSGQRGALAQPVQQGRGRPDIRPGIDTAVPLLLRWPEAGRAGGDGQPRTAGKVLAHPQVREEQPLIRSDQLAPRRHRAARRGGGEKEVPWTQIPVDEL